MTRTQVTAQCRPRGKGERCSQLRWHTAVFPNSSDAWERRAGLRQTSAFAHRSCWCVRPRRAGRYREAVNEAGALAQGSRCDPPGGGAFPAPRGRPLSPPCPLPGTRADPPSGMKGLRVGVAAVEPRAMRGIWCQGVRSPGPPWAAFPALAPPDVGKIKEKRAKERRQLGAGEGWPGRRLWGPR